MSFVTFRESPKERFVMAEVWISAQRAADMLGVSKHSLYRKHEIYGFRTRDNGRLEFLLKEVVDAGGDVEAFIQARERRKESKRAKTRERVAQQVAERVATRTAGDARRVAFRSV